MSGCDWKGPNSLPLPGTAGGGPDGYSVTVQLADVTTLDRNARVRVGDVTVGRIADIRLGPGFAEVTVDPDGEVRLPRNATARVGQSSLLGASHLELSAPPGEPAEGTLSDEWHKSVGEFYTLDGAMALREQAFKWRGDGRNLGGAAVD